MNERNEKKLKLSTIWSYAFAQGSGYQIMGAVVGAYLMIFLTDTFGAPAAAVSVIMVLASVWDAVNDPMMGTIADRINSRWGKYRPYLLFIPLLLTVVVVALFASPNLSVTGKIIWTAVFYVAYGMLRTAIEIPCGALINAVTNLEAERNKMISAYTLTMGIFTTVTTSLALVLVTFFGGGNTAKGYMIVMGIASLFATMSMAYNTMLMTEMTDYIYLRTGNMMNGTLAALKGFSNKCGIAIANGAVGAVLAATGSHGSCYRSRIEILSHNGRNQE